jgi:hypothetical protein
MKSSERLVNFFHSMADILLTHKQKPQKLAIKGQAVMFCRRQCTRGGKAWPEG